MAREWTREYWEKARTSARARLRKGRWPRAPMWTVILGIFAGVIALIILNWDWNILRGPLERYASSSVGRTVTIDGNIAVDFGWTSHVTVDRVSIANPDWAQAQAGRDMARIDRIAFDIPLLPLLHGFIAFPNVEIERPSVDLVRDKSGRANWRFGNEGGAPIQMPTIGRLIVSGGRVHLADEKHATTFSGVVESRLGDDEGKGSFTLTGDGVVGGHPFSASLSGDSPLRANGDPYAFTAHMHMGASTIAATGTIPRPFNLDSIDASLDASGNDLADLYHLTGLAFPNTPPYHLRGRLTRDGDLWKVARLSGTVGHSDIAGWMSVDATNERPFLRADVASRMAHLDDITTVFGERGGGHTVPTRVAAAMAGKPAPATMGTPTAAAATSDTSFLLPDAPLRVERVRHMDARVHYTAAVIQTGGVPMKDLAVTAKLDHGVLTVDPARVTLALGKLSGRATIDARQDVPDVDLDVRLADARIEEFFHLGRTGQTPIAGDLEATAHLHGKGASVYRAVANATGDIHFAVPGGEIRQEIAELLGINVINGLGLMLSHDQSTTPLRCAVADFHADNGVLTVRRLVVDTGIVLATGTGSANLRDETMNLTLEGHPKKFRIGRVMAPITLTGPWANPHIGIEAGKAVAQVGVAAALGAVLSPLAALLPFVSTGTTKDVDCARLLAGAPLPAPASN